MPPGYPVGDLDLAHYMLTRITHANTHTPHQLGASPGLGTAFAIRARASFYMLTLRPTDLANIMPPNTP
jgi:hypothetical protein